MINQFNNMTSGDPTYFENSEKDIQKSLYLGTQTLNAAKKFKRGMSFRKKLDKKTSKLAAKFQNRRRDSLKPYQISEKKA